MQGAIKPGEILLAPGKHFTEGIWWDAAEASQDGNGAAGQVGFLYQ